MENLVFRCSQTGSNVQIGLTVPPFAEHDDAYEAVSCPACGRLHLVNKRTGRTLSDREGSICPTLQTS
jgi:DNA-directed RNA polymerase subunit RPC12/RpoP